MRIIGGKFKSQKLNYPKDSSKLRPTKDMVKEALFSIIYDRIIGASFLDLFAGVGSIGLEALSRGAAKVVFVETHPKFIYQNVESLACQDQVQIIKQPAGRYLDYLGSVKEQFDLIFLDPPYEQELAEDSLNKLYRFDILKKNGLVILETDKKINIVTDFKLVKERIYGQTKLLIMEKK